MARNGSAGENLVEIAFPAAVRKFAKSPELRNRQKFGVTWLFEKKPLFDPAGHSFWPVCSPLMLFACLKRADAMRARNSTRPNAKRGVGFPTPLLREKSSEQEIATSE